MARRSIIHSIRLRSRMSSRWTALAALSLSGALLMAGFTPARADKLMDKSDRFLQHKAIHLPAASQVTAIVQISGKVSTHKEAQLKSMGASIYRRLPLIHAVAVQVGVDHLSQLADLPFVKHLSEDTVLHKHDEFTVGSSEADVAFQQYGLDGTGVTVAVLDSGVRTSPDLITGINTHAKNRSRIAAEVSFINDGSGTDDPCGHGTHVAGIISGNGAASSGSHCFRTFYGIARNANIVNVRVLDANGAGTVSTVIEGIQWAINNQATYNIRVMNLSLGHPIGESYTTDPLCKAVEQAWQAGIVVVCAAGNDGRLNATATPGLDNEGYGANYGSIEVPGNDPYVITVGAMKSMDGVRADDTIATYSSRGPSRLDFVLKPDIVAPGNKVISLRSTGSYLDTTYGSTNTVPLSDYKSTASKKDTSQYFQLSGTSMAAPVVSGAAALLLQQDPTLTPDTVKARLMISADKWGFSDGSMDPCTFGAGYLNIPAALNCTVIATQNTLSPTLSQDSAGDVLLNIDNAIWGHYSLWGTGINDLHAIWGKDALLGSNTLSSSHAIWGKSVWNVDDCANADTGMEDMSNIYGE